MSRGRGLRWVRRVTLSASVFLIAFVPIWHRVDDRAREGEVSSLGPLGDALAQAGAPPVVGALWSVSVRGCELMDPLAAASLLATGLAVPIAAVLPTLVLSALLGRFFCGYLCPYVPLLATSRALRRLLARVGFEPRDHDLGTQSSFFVLVAALGSGAVLGSHVVVLLYPPAAISRELFLWTTYGSAGSGLLLIAVVFLFDTLVSRAGFCRTLCPGGASFRLLATLSPVVIRRDPRRCTECGDCVVVCNLGQAPMTDRLDAGCERCGACIEACAPGALRLGLRRLPVLDAGRRKLR